MLLAMIALAGVWQAAPQLEEAPAVRAQRNLAEFVYADDYPLEALRNEEEGTVHFRLFVGTDGHVTDCAVTGSSRSASLDETTCRIMLERLRFQPTIGRDGRPTEDEANASVTWRIAERRRRPRSGDAMLRARPTSPLGSLVTHQDLPPDAGNFALPTSSFQLTVAPNGSVSACNIVGRSRSPMLDRLACELMYNRARFSPALDAANNAVADRYWGHINWREVAQPSVGTTASEPGE